VIRTRELLLRVAVAVGGLAFPVWSGTCCIGCCTEPTSLMSKRHGPRSPAADSKTITIFVGRHCQAPTYPAKFIVICLVIALLILGVVIAINP
jgi:hypothetical protein